MSNIEKNKKSIPKPTHFGKNLKLLRRLGSLSQQELAKELQVNRNNIASYESGIVEPHAKLFLKTCEYFDKQPSEMLETIMIEHVLDDVSLNDPNKESVKQYLLDHVEQFIFQTNEMTKIHEGYTALLEMKIEENKDLINGDLLASFSDILDLLRSLIRLNWKTIQQLFPDLHSTENNLDQ